MQKESKFFKQHSLNCTPSPEEWMKRGREKKNTKMEISLAACLMIYFCRVSGYKIESEVQYHFKGVGDVKR